MTEPTETPPEESLELLPVPELGAKHALLIGVYQGKPQREMAEEHLDELEFLAQTFGVETAVKMPTSVRKFDAGTFVSQGKLEELIEVAKQEKVDIVIFDDEISPAQQRNLEKLFEVTVMDRTELILDVFAQRAQTREARLQIELARTKYMFPRLKRLWTHLSRQRMTGGFLKGEGEKQIEIDKRLLQRRVDRLTKQLKEVKAQRELQRQARKRSEIPTFAIVGYTNAGKSTLLNALTDAGVFVEDKLFATLDTTTRKFTLPNNQDILLIDTVGFIRKLPHQLVAAFKSTLEEAVHADILLHLLDVSHPSADEHVDSTYEVLKELGIQKTPIITVLNKMDAVEEPSSVNRFRLRLPRTIKVSAKERQGFDELLHAMVQELSKLRKIVDYRVPQSEYHIVSELNRDGHVLRQDYEENDVLIKVELPQQLIGRYEKYEAEPAS